MGCVVIMFVLGLLAMLSRSWGLALFCFIVASSISLAVKRR
jgi:hypothetical protein